MRHEDATAAINFLREWYGGVLSQQPHVDGKLALLISTILEAKQLSDWLHENGDTRGEDSQRESVDLLWAVVRACDVDAIRSAITTAKEYADEVRARKAKPRIIDKSVN